MAIFYAIADLLLLTALMCLTHPLYLFGADFCWEPQKKKEWGGLMQWRGRSGRRALTEKTSNHEEEAEEGKEGKGVANELEGIPIAPSFHQNANKAGVTFILEKASLEVAKVGKVNKLHFSFLGFCIYMLWNMKTWFFLLYGGVVLWVLGFQGLGFYLLLWEFYIGVSSGFVELLSLVLYKKLYFPT